jgi:glycosyltransferase involved in cell wall biosynthesis
VVEVEYASLLVEDHPKYILLLQTVVEKMLASPYCRGIRCWSQAGLRTLIDGLQSDLFASKVTLIPHAIPARARFVRQSTGDSIKLLFVGSSNIRGQFEIKGGRELIETFLLLKRRYPKLELVVRSDVPPDIKAKVSGIGGLCLIENDISWEDLEHEYQTADIFLLPSHSTPPFTFLDAMSFELPIVSVNAWANNEFVVDGITGLLAARSQRVPYTFRGTQHPNFGAAQFVSAVRQVDPEVVGGLVQRTSLLIENAELRGRLGKRARWEVESGRFSMEERNMRLARFLDVALEGRGP